MSPFPQGMGRNPAVGYADDIPRDSIPRGAYLQELTQQLQSVTDGINQLQFTDVQGVDNRETHANYQHDNNFMEDRRFSDTLAPKKAMNQLTTVDLLKELPPPVSDLSLEPPPILVPQNLATVPSALSNCSPDYFRSTLNAIPKNNNLLKKSKLPFALMIKPYQFLHDDIDPIPVISDRLIIRCRRCRSYINSFVEFIEQGRRWKCNICGINNNCPVQIDKNQDGSPANRFDRNELKCSMVEYIAPPEYCIRAPPPSVYTFVLDVSHNALVNGFLTTSINTLLETLDSIPNHDGRTMVSIICVDNAIHYFSIPEDSKSTCIKMMDIIDLEVPFTPSPNDLLVSLEHCWNNIHSILEKIPLIFKDNHHTKFALGPSLRSASNLIAKIGGKIIVLSSTLPNIGVGKLNVRIDIASVDTPNISQKLLSCQDSFYKTFTVECNKHQISVDMFLASDRYMDIATISNLSRYTGGQTHFYPGFIASKVNDVTKFTTEFARHISMDLSWESVMRVRSSTGIKTNSFYGHFFNRSSDLCAFPAIPRDQSYVFEMSIDEPLTGEYCFMQVALLLSLNNGERRIRVITTALPTTDSLREIFASADQLAITACIMQKAIEKAFKSSLDDARLLITNSLEQILSAYSRDVIQSNTTGTLPLRICENLRMLPLLLSSLLKNIAFRSGIVPSDHRAFALNKLESMPLDHLMKAIYPTVYSLHDMSNEVGLPDDFGSIMEPPIINSSLSSFKNYGLYLIDNGSELFLWVGGDAVPQLLLDVFGVLNIGNLILGKQELSIVENSDFNKRIRNVLAKLRGNYDTVTYQSLYIVRSQADDEDPRNTLGRDILSLRLWATSFLVEDKILKSESYREYVQKLKVKINK